MLVDDDLALATDHLHNMAVERAVAGGHGSLVNWMYKHSLTQKRLRLDQYLPAAHPMWLINASSIQKSIMSNANATTVSSIPIIMGVTGHRDILPQDIPLIRKALREHLSALQERYAHSAFRLISGLAEGADRLAAEVALELGFGLVAALPMAQAEYEKDFGTVESIEHFRKLVSNAQVCFVVKSTENDETSDKCASENPRDNKYLALGRYIAQNSQIVIALWDGISEQVLPDGTSKILRGGTADVVRLCRVGLYSNDPTQLETQESTRVDHLMVRRIQKSTSPTENINHRIGEWLVLTDQSKYLDNKKNEPMEKVLQSINKFNKFINNSLSSSDLNTSRKYLLGENYPKGVTHHLALPIATFCAADAAAGIRQKEKSDAIIRITILAISSIICQQIYSGPDMRWGWLAAHIGLAAVAFALFYWFFKSDHPQEEEYLDWRALAEAMRIQIFWKAVGIHNCVADHYISSDGEDLDWIRQAVRNSVIGIDCIEISGAIKLAHDAWLHNQYEYFKDKELLHNKNKTKFLKLTKFCFGIAVILTISTLLFHWSGVSDAVLNDLVLISGVSFLLSAVVKTYADQMAFEETENRYRGMKIIFHTAKDRYDNLIISRDIKNINNIFFNIGKEALTENAGWLRLHRERQFKPPSP